jgi:hypothetical protein
MTRDSSGLTVHPITDIGELKMVQALRDRIKLVPSALDEWTRVARVAVKADTEIAMDDDTTKWRNLSHSVTYQLNHAADALRTLCVLIPPDGELRMPFVSHFPVVRSALEAASLAHWIVGPDDPRIRVERQLRNAWREVSEESALMSSIASAIEKDSSLGTRSQLDQGRKQAKIWKRKQVQQIRTAARAVGLDDPTKSTWTIGFAEIVREATVAIELPGTYGETVWRELSALSHPSMIRATRSMHTEQMHHNDDGTLAVIMSSKVAAVKYSLEAAQLQFSAAVRTFGRRKIVPGDSSRYHPTAL